MNIPTDNRTDLIAEDICHILYGLEYSTSGRIGDVREWLIEEYDDSDDGRDIQDIAEMYRDWVLSQQEET